MSVLFPSQSRVRLPAYRFHCGQAVHVNIHAGWLPATVTDLTPSSVGVDYDRLPRPCGPLATQVAPWVVRPAEGARLKAVHRLSADDDVLAADNTTFRVATAWRGRDGWWVVQYTHDQHAILPPRAVLRLLDPIPTVTVRGIPLGHRSPA